MGKANIAATFAEDLCNSPNYYYSQQQRWGDSSLCIDYIDCEGTQGVFYHGGRDCSSFVIDVWREALKNTDFAHTLDTATYTGNMLDVFTSSGLFEWYGINEFVAQRGDIYLTHKEDGNQHTALCTSAVPDMLAEFSGGDVDKSVRPYYDLPWTGILHYNGGAD